MIMSFFTDAEEGEAPRPGVREAGLTSAAAAVAYAGALPLIGAAIFGWARPEEAPRVLELMALYGITLLSFFGGVRWGVAVMGRGGPTYRQLLGAVIPMLIAMGAFFLRDVTQQLILLVVVIPILLVDDLQATRRGSGAPAWYLGVRGPLTVMMEASLVAGLWLALTTL